MLKRLMQVVFLKAVCGEVTCPGQHLNIYFIFCGPSHFSSFSYTRNFSFKNTSDNNPVKENFLVYEKQSEYSPLGDSMPEPFDLIAFGERLRQVRTERQKTLKQVFDETGISIATISRIERGDANEVESKTLAD